MERESSVNILIFYIMVILVSIATISIYCMFPDMFIGENADGDKAEKESTAERANTITIPNDVATRDVETAAKALTEAVNADSGNGQAICALFSKEKGMAVWNNASIFANTFVNKGHKIDETYVLTNKFTPLDGNKEGGDADSIKYENVMCLLASWSDIYCCNIDFFVEKDGGIFFDRIYIRANRIYSDREVYENVANIKEDDDSDCFYFIAKDVFDTFDTEDDNYDGERRIINKEIYHWDSSSNMLNAESINMEEWERQKKASEFRDIYGVPGYMFNYGDSSGYMYYAIDATSGRKGKSYLCVEFNEAGYVSDMTIVTAAGSDTHVYKIQ